MIARFRIIYVVPPETWNPTCFVRLDNQRVVQVFEHECAGRIPALGEFIEIDEMGKRSLIASL